MSNGGINVLGLETDRNRESYRTMATNISETDEREQLQVLTALIIGAVITLVGILGFVLVPVEGRLFGIFGVNTPHNIVHFVTGIVGLAAGYLAAGAFSSEYNKYGGLAYLVLAGLWLIIPAFLNNLLNIDLADTLLHLGLGVILAAIGFGVADRVG